MPLPSVAPVIPRVRETPFDNPEWQFELKYDGFRAIFYFERATRCEFISRNQKPLPRFGALAHRVAEVLSCKSVILDGEVVSFDEKGIPRLDRVRRAGFPLSYIVFDLLWLDGEDLRRLPLRERRARLEKLVPESADIRHAVVHLGEGKKLFDLICRHNLEGIVAKPLESNYVRGAWRKILNPEYPQKQGRASFRRR